MLIQYPEHRSAKENQFPLFRRYTRKTGSHFSADALGDMSLSVAVPTRNNGVIVLFFRSAQQIIQQWQLAWCPVRVGRETP